MLGAIAGDVIGSVHEFMGRKTREFPLFAEGSRFTDDTVLTVAVAEYLRTGDSLVDETCQATVPEAITAVLDSDGYEEAIRLAISLGGDADTLACIAGGIAGPGTEFLARLPRTLSRFSTMICETLLLASAKPTRFLCRSNPTGERRRPHEPERIDSGCQSLFGRRIAVFRMCCFLPQNPRHDES